MAAVLGDLGPELGNGAQTSCARRCPRGEGQQRAAGGAGVVAKVLGILGCCSEGAGDMGTLFWRSWGHTGGAGDTQVLPGGEHTGRASTLTHSFPFLFLSLHRSSSPSLHPIQLSLPHPHPRSSLEYPSSLSHCPQTPQQYFPLPAGKGCSAPSAPGVLRMSAVPEPLGRPRSSSFRSLGGTLEATLGMGPLEAEREEMRILKVCFYSNSFNMGKNFKLVKCPVTTEIRVRGAGRRTGGHLVRLGAVCPSGGSLSIWDQGEILAGGFLTAW